MKLMDALKTGYMCGLETVGEAIDNVSIHAMSMFKYEDIDHEMLELERESSSLNYSISIASVLGEKRCKSIETEMTNDLT